MFEDALLESSRGSRHRTSIWTKGLSFTVEAFLLGLAVLAPLLYTEALPRQILDILQLPTPPAAAPASRTRSVVSHPTTHSELINNQVMLPTTIPNHVHEIQDELARDSGLTDDPNGVVGAPPNGPTTGTIPSLLDGLPPAMPKNVPPHSVRVSSGVAQGLLIHEVQPQYPPLARRARIQGAVVLQATIGRDGTIQNLHLVSGHPLLMEAAMEAVKQWRYRPYLLNNEPVDVDTTIEVNFTLNGDNK